jgi:hypothetical protein
MAFFVVMAIIWTLCLIWGLWILERFLKVYANRSNVPLRGVLNAPEAPTSSEKPLGGGVDLAVVNQLLDASKAARRDFSGVVEAHGMDNLGVEKKI